MNLRSWALSLILAAFSITGYAADDSIWRHRVSVSVDCEDSTLKSQITSFVSRELRSLRDVDITDTDPSYKLTVVAIAVTLKGGDKAGYAFSVLVTEPSGDRSWALPGDLKPDSKALISQMFADLESLRDHQLLVGSFDSLKQSLTEIIAGFDANELEPRRRFWQRLRDAAKKKKP